MPTDQSQFLQRDILRLKSVYKVSKENASYYYKFFKDSN